MTRKLLVTLMLVTAGAWSAASDTFSLLGVRIAMSVDEAKAVLDKLGTRTVSEDTRSGGDKLAWSFKEGAFTSVVAAHGYQGPREVGLCILSARAGGRLYPAR